MRVDTDQPHLARHLHAISSILTEQGGFVADDFTVRERNGHYSCAIGEQFGVPDRVLVSYPPHLRVPMWRLTWSDDPDVMAPIAGLADLHPVHRALVDEWLPLVNDTGKLAHIRTVVPKHAVRSWPLRHHLADAGYPAMRLAPADTKPKDTLLGWHSTGEGNAAATSADPDAAPAASPAGGEPPPHEPRWRLIPLKHLVNHDPSGATQTGVPGRTSVVTSASSDATETFENYGDLDALQLLMSFGYVAPEAPLVHSVPVTVEAPGFGTVRVRGRSPRYGEVKVPAADDVPVIAPADDGLVLRHLAIRPTNRARVARLLAMAAQSRAGASAADAARSAEHLLDLVGQANLDYYRRLDELVAGLAGAGPRAAAATGAAAAPSQSHRDETTILAMLAEVSMRQQQALRDFWS